MWYTKHERPCLTTFPNTEERAENSTRTEVFLTNFEVFGNVVYIFSIETETKEKYKWNNKIEKLYANYMRYSNTTAVMTCFV